MSNEVIAFAGPVIGVIVGALGTIGVTWITKYYEERSSYRKMIIETSMEYYKEALIAAREVAKSSGVRSYAWPYESFVISISHLVNRVVNRNFKIDDIEGVVIENKRLIKAMEKLYSKKTK